MPHNPSSNPERRAHTLAVASAQAWTSADPSEPEAIGGGNVWGEDASRPVAAEPTDSSSSGSPVTSQSGASAKEKADARYARTLQTIRAMDEAFAHTLVGRGE